MIDLYIRKNLIAQVTDEQEIKELINNGIASKTLDEIKNDSLYKYSPYKVLNDQQESVVYDVICNIDEAIAEGGKSVSVISGDAGTGKTIVIMFLTKLIADLQTFDNTHDEVDDDSRFKLFFEDDTFALIKTILSDYRFYFLVIVFAVLAIFIFELSKWTYKELKYNERIFNTLY